MVVQALLDSLSRCFGAPLQGISARTAMGESNGQNTQSNSGPGPTLSGKSNRYAEDGEALDSRRKQGRALGIELHDQEWDALFADDPGVNRTGGRGEKNDSENNRHSRSKKRGPNMEVGYADVLAKAKEAAKPSKHASPRKVDRKNDIFRSRSVPNPSFASRLLGHDGFAKALCFANPVHDCSNGGQGITKADSYGANTVNTAEDTLTSTVCFEAKHSHLVETRPPMPLFDRYKVECDETQDNALIGIVNSGSHHSIHMLRAFQEHVDQIVSSNSETQFIPVSDNDVDMETDSDKAKCASKQEKPLFEMKGYGNNFKKSSDHPPEMQAISENSMSTNQSGRSLSSGNQNSPQFYAV